MDTHGDRLPRLTLKAGRTVGHKEGVALTGAFSFIVRQEMGNELAEKPRGRCTGHRCRFLLTKETQHSILPFYYTTSTPTTFSLSASSDLQFPT
jgi:hypothetical protein